MISQLNGCRHLFVFLFYKFIILPLHRRWNGGILDSTPCLSVHVSVHPSVCRQGFRNFLKKVLAQFISYLAFIPLWGESWPLYIFIYLGSLSALWWPNIWPKKGFPELFEKTNDSIHFIPGIYPNGVSFLTPIHFRVPSLIFVPLVAKNLAENGVSRIFWKKLLTQFTSYLASILMGWVSWPLYIFVFLASFSALWWPNIWLKMGFPGFFFFFLIHKLPRYLKYHDTLVGKMMPKFFWN